MDSDATTASPTRRKRDAGRVSDERPWWDTFPGWGVVGAAAFGRGLQSGPGLGAVTWHVAPDS